MIWDNESPPMIGKVAGEGGATRAEVIEQHFDLIFEEVNRQLAGAVAGSSPLSDGR